MSGRLTIQRVPKGLLDALNMKGSGDTPTDLAPLVQSQFDSTTLYLQDIRRINGPNVMANPSAGSYTTNAGLTVPAGEQWMMIQALFRLTTDVTGAGRFALGYGTPGATPVCVFAFFETDQVIAAGTAANYNYGRRFQFGELILPPGYNIGLYTSSVVANVTGACNLEYYRMVL
jgi:hypothetical protein